MKAIVKQIATTTFIAILLVVGNVKSEATETKASKAESIETELQLENWMIDETIWNSNTAIFVDFVQETETELNLENWMTNTETWNVNFRLTEEMETEMELENWMIDGIRWEMNNQEYEPELNLESWMINKCYWK